MTTKRIEEYDKFFQLYKKQLEFQKLIGNTDIPRDDPDMMAHHLLGLVTEVGEVSQADKRWKKNKRNTHYDKLEKVMEISDVFIFLLNVLIYSDIPPEAILSSVEMKIQENTNRYKKEN